MSRPRIKRALISVYDKTGIVEFAKALHDELGIEIVSTGGTARLLMENGVAVTLVEEITGFPEMLDGRVKTLHPKIHAAILADRDNPEHMRQLKEQGIEPIDMVVVNLYPFEKTVADPECSFERAIEMIDIGGPCLLRAAAKNHKHVMPIVRESQHGLVLDLLRGEGASEHLDWAGCASEAAAIAFETTQTYDKCVHGWLQGTRKVLPYYYSFDYLDWGRLRYGENPHQVARLWQLDVDSAAFDLTTAGQRGGIDWQWLLSFNNYADADAAARLCNDLARGLPKWGAGFQPVHQEGQSAGSEPLDGERHTRRNLTHIQAPGKTHFLTLRLKKGELQPAERDLVLSACKHWDGKKLCLHAAVIMPDHAHMLITPLETKPGEWVALGEITHSIKRDSAMEVNKLRGVSGALWQDESFDRIIRDHREYENIWNYIGNNPLKLDLAGDNEYPWYYSQSGAAPRECPRSDAVHGLKTGATPGPTRHVCTFIKHTNACGVGFADEPVEAYRRAYIGDPNAAMGGVLACSFDVTASFADTVMNTYGNWGKQAGASGFFVEVWVAPGFDDDAIKTIREGKKWGKRVRLLDVASIVDAPGEDEVEYKSVSGGILKQTRDNVGLNEDQWNVVTKRRPTDREMDDLRLAWLVAKHTKSNAISICRDGILIGNGAGQMSRVMSCRIATWLARENGHAERLTGSVAASDAFFPFRDGPDILIGAGVTAIIQPGGSKRDDDTIQACDEHDAAMIFTGTRHFRH